MKKIMMAALATLTLLTGCSPEASDGYKFEKESQRLSERQIKVVLLPSLEAVKSQYAARGAKPLPANRELMAYSVIGPMTCTIYMIDPKVRYMPEFFGHELTHCLYGEFHPSQNG